jgi:hypothetical protein
MTEEQAKQAQKLLDELKELRKINELLTNKKYGKNVNVRFHQHYGECEDYERIVVEDRHFPRFLKVLRHVISDVEEELHKL